MKILIIGLPYFANKLVANLSSYDKRNKYLAIDSSNHKIKYLFHLLNTDIVYSIGGTTGKSKAINIALLLKKKIIFHWVGTDVLTAINYFKNNLIEKKYIEQIVHFSEVEWIQEELRDIVDTSIVSIAMFPKFESPPPLPEKFSVLSYVAKGREEFYGINKLINLATHFPNIEIKIAGISEYKESLPNNIKLLGWVSNMDEQYKNCILYLRLVEHDGLAFSVLEAMAAGRYVGYSYKFDNVFHIDNYLKLEAIVKDLYEQHKRKILKLNELGIAFIKQNYSEVKVVEKLIDRFEIVLNSRKDFIQK
jgi:hypothetical protein